MKNKFKVGDIVSILNNNLGVVISVINEDENFKYLVVPMLTLNAESVVPEYFFEKEVTVIKVNNDAIQCLYNGKKRMDLIREAEKRTCEHPVCNPHKKRG